MAEFESPQSRNEAILQNILGANNDLLPPESRIETLLQQLLAMLGGGGDEAEVEVDYKLINKQNISIKHNTQARARYNAYLILSQMGILYVTVADWTVSVNKITSYEYTVTATVDQTAYEVDIDLGFAWNVGVVIPILSDQVASVSFS